MIIEVFGERVTITDMIAVSDNKIIESVVNLALTERQPPQRGPLFVLYEFFGDNVKLIEDFSNNNNDGEY